MSELGTVPAVPSDVSVTQPEAKPNNETVSREAHLKLLDEKKKTQAKLEELQASAVKSTPNQGLQTKALLQ